MALSTSLTHYWKLDESTGDAVDSVGSLTAVNTSTTYATGKINNGASFNGSTSKLLTAGFSGGTDWSVSFWYKPTTINTTKIPIVMDTVSGSQRIFDFSHSSGNLIYVDAWASDGTMISHTPTASGMSAGTWYYMTITWSNAGNALILYKNAVSHISVATGSRNARTDSTPFAMGFRPFGAGDNFADCMIDEVGYWTRALTADEVSQLFNSGRANAYPLTDTPSLYGGVAYYNLDESSGNASDSINAYTLTNTGTVTYGAAKINNGALFPSNSSAKVLGTSTYTPFDFERTNSFSISGWVKFNSIIGNQWIVSHQTGTAQGWSVLSDNKTNRLQFFLTGTSGDALYTRTPNNSITAGAWYHVVCTYAGTSLASGVHIYLDGVDQTLTVGTNNLSSSIKNTTQFQIGNRTDGGGWNCDASIDEVGVWNKVLSSTEVTALYGGGAGNQYPFSSNATMVAETATFALTGIAVSLNAGATMLAGVANFILTGMDALFRVGGFQHKAKHEMNPTHKTKHMSSFTHKTKH